MIHQNNLCYIAGGLRIDCKNCFGFCCAALYFSASEGFPADKDAGRPCVNLQPDFRCRIHGSLAERGLKGCVAYDCFGAGQKVAVISFGKKDWIKDPSSAKLMFDVFLIMRQLHELLWYLTEALTLQPARPLYGALKILLDETENFTRLSPGSLLELDIAAHGAEVDALLKKASELVRTDTRGRQKTVRRKLCPGADLIGADLRKTDLRGADLRKAYLIAADFRGTDLAGTDFIGADIRDADFRGADLSGSIFLTQMQINAAKGDASAKLPPQLVRPDFWKK